MEGGAKPFEATMSIYVSSLDVDIELEQELFGSINRNYLKTQYRFHDMGDELYEILILQLYLPMDHALRKERPFWF